LELSNKKELNQLDILQDQVINYPSEDSVANQNKKIEKILILDTETTGLDENKDEVIEIGCILFDVSFKCALSQVSFLFPVSNNEAEYVNGISAEVTNISQPWEDGLNFFFCWSVSHSKKLRARILGQLHEQRPQVPLLCRDIRYLHGQKLLA